MACRVEPVQDPARAASWHYCPDDLQAPGVRLGAIVMARLIDEITGLPVLGATVRALDARSAPHLTRRTAPGGVLGLAGRPAEIFPDLGSAAAPVPMAIAAPGYLPQRLDGMLGPIAGFPAVFGPLDHGEVAAHRCGVALRGRVVQRGSPASTALAGASVAIDGVWPTLPPAYVNPAAVMQPARMTALFPGLYRDRPSATLARCNVLENLAEAKTLMAPAPAGSTRLRLSNRRTLAAGMPLQLDGAGELRELMAIAAVDTSLSDDQAAWVTLAWPLAHLHRPGTSAVPASIPATFDPRTLARPGAAGDTIAFLSAAAPWADLAVVRVDDGVNAPEYHTHQRYATVSDGDGYFVLPALARLALFRLRVTHPGPPAPLLLTIEPDYGLAQQNLHVAFE